MGRSSDRAHTVLGLLTSLGLAAPMVTSGCTTGSMERDGGWPVGTENPAPRDAPFDSPPSIPDTSVGTENPAAPFDTGPEDTGTDDAATDDGGDATVDDAGEVAADDAGDDAGTP